MKSGKQQLTPESSLRALEERFELGQKNYKKKAWNAFTNQEQLDDWEWIGERIAHAELHIKHFHKVAMGIIPDDGDDDGAAIMWLGCMLHEAYERRKRLNGSKLR